jgi:hypothetical protein
MNEWLIELKNIAGGKISGKIIVAALDLQEAKQKALQECRKYLPERRNFYLEAKGNGVYTIVSDLEDVGEIVIRRHDQA